MELMSNCSNPKGVESITQVKTTPGRVLAHVAAIGLMLLSSAIMLAFSGPIHVEPHFQNMANMIFGFGILCLLGGGRIAVSLSFGTVSTRDMRILKLLCDIGMTLSILTIVIGAWVNSMP